MIPLRRFKKEKAWSLYLVLLTGLSLVVWGQEAPTEMEDDEIVTLQEFEISASAVEGYISTQSISATRTAAQVIEVPQVINIITREYIEDSGADYDFEILKNTSPGVTLRSYNNQDITIRGFRALQSSLDGSANRIVMSIPAALIERTEVVKGPSSILYGPFSGAGGYVNNITKKPQSVFRGEATASIGTDGYYRGLVDVTGPIEFFDSSVEYRVILETNAGDYPGFEGSEDEGWLVHGRLKFLIGKTGELMVGGLYRDRNHRGVRAVINPSTGTNGTRDNPGVAGEPLYGVDLGAPFEQGLWNTQMKFFDLRYLSKPSSNFSFRAYYAYEDGEHSGNFFSGGGGPIPADGIYGVTGIVNDQQNRHHNAAMDATWIHNQGDLFENQFTFGADMNYRSAGNQRGFSNRPVSSGVQDLDTQNIDAYFNQPEPDIPFNDVTDAQELTAGFYLQNNLKFWEDRIRLAYGWRYNYAGATRNRVTDQALVNPDGTLDLPNVNFNDWQSDFVDDSYISERYGITVRPVSNVALFWGTSDSFNGNGTALLADSSLAPPEVSDGSEFGIKVDMLYGFTGTLSFFEVEVQNRLEDDPNNLGFKRIRPPLSNEGWELSLAWQYENFSIIGGYYSGDLTDEASGFRPDREPNETLNFWGRYQFTEGPLAGLSIGGGTNWVGDALTDGGSRVLSDYQTVDAFLSYQLNDWKIQLNGTNITDERFIFRYIRAGLVFPGPLARYKLTVSRYF